MNVGLRKAADDEDALMLSVGAALDRALFLVGEDARKQVTQTANSLGVSPQEMSYIFWALATKSGLPRLADKQQRAFDLMIDIMVGTQTMPNYEKGFRVPQSLAVDDAVDGVTRQMALWSIRVMLPALLRHYDAALKDQAKHVPKFTSGRVSLEQGYDFLRLSFRRILDMRSAWFRNGRLLRQVVRALPI